MNKIERVSRVLRMIFRVSLILLPILAMSGWIWFEEFKAIGMMDNVNDVSLSSLNMPSPLPVASKIAAMAATLIPLTIDMFALFFLSRLFGLYAEGHIFTEASVGYIRRIGYTLLIGQGLHPVHQALLTLALTFKNPVGQRMIQIGFGSANLSEIIMAIMIIVVAWIMDEGRRLSEEQALVI